MTRTDFEALLEKFAWAHYAAQEGTDLKTADRERAALKAELLQFFDEVAHDP